VRYILTPAASERKSSENSDLASCRTIGTTSVSSSATRIIIIIIKFLLLTITIKHNEPIAS